MVVFCSEIGRKEGPAKMVSGQLQEGGQYKEVPFVGTQVVSTVMAQFERK